MLPERGALSAIMIKTECQQLYDESFAEKQHKLESIGAGTAEQSLPPRRALLALHHSCLYIV